MDVQALNLIEAVARRLKGSHDSVYPVDLKELDNGSVWGDALPNTRTDSVEVLRRETNEHLERLSKSEELLKLMLGSIQNLQHRIKADRFRKAASQQFSQLPEELLVKIMEMCFHTVQWDTRPHREQLRSFATVNRRLRHVLTLTPQFWTVLSADMRKSELKTFMKRSGSCPLHIRAEYREYDSLDDSEEEVSGDELNMVTFLREVIPHCHRWGTVKISFYALQTVENPDWGTIEETCLCLSDLHLPLLSSLEVQFPPRCQLSDDVGDDRDELHFYLSWNFPILKEFKTRLMMPRVLAREPIPRLSSCEIRLDDGAWQYSDWPLSSLFYFLNSQTSLENLSLYMVDFPQGMNFNSVSFLQRHLPIKMHSLLTLIIKVLKLETRDEFTAYVVPEIIRSLDTPALVTLDVDFPLVNSAFVVDDIFPQHKVYPQLVRLSFALRHLPFEGFYVHLLLFRRIFEVAANLRHLSINALDADIEDLGLQSVIHVPPPLKTITFRDCRYLEVKDIRAVLHCLQRSANWKFFEQMRIVSCPRIGKREIQSLPLSGEFLEHTGQ